MKPSRLLWIVLVLLVPVAPAVMLYNARRSVSPIPVAGFADLEAAFDPAASAGVFVGVQKYADPAFTRVQYAVDDAIDLAYTFVLQCGTIPANRAALALTGTPEKRASKVRLQQLKNAGVAVTGATQAEILRHLGRYERVHGLFVVSFAGHGFSKDGTPYLATSTSGLEHPATWLSSARVLDLAAERAGRSLVLLDACRERVAQGTRSVAPAPAAALISKMQKAHGQVVLYAAPAGGWAYDDTERRNGVFTAAVIDGLQCGAKRRTITADTLATHVAKEVGDWIRRHKHAGAKSVIQINVDDRAKKMPLVACSGPKSPPPANPIHAGVDGRSLIYLDKAQQKIRTVNVGEPITQAEVADLDADLANEVIAAAGGRILIFEATGALRRSVDMNAASLYPPTSSLRVLSFRVDRLFFGDLSKQIVAVAVDPRGSASRFAIIKRDGTFFDTSLPRGTVRDFLLSADRHSAFLQKIVAWTSDRVFLLDPKTFGKETWNVPSAARIVDVHVADRNEDKRYELAVRRADGVTDYLDFEGRPVAQ